MIARPKRGCTCVTTHLIQATARPTITARLIGHTSRRSSLTCPKGLLSLVAELFSSNTCRHRPHKAGKRFHSHFGPIRISYRQHRARSRRVKVWLAKSMAAMICSRHEASVFSSYIDAGPCDEPVHSYQLFDAANANFRAFRPLPDSFTKRPGAGKSGTNSHRHATNGSMAGVGVA